MAHYWQDYGKPEGSEWGSVVEPLFPSVAGVSFGGAPARPPPPPAAVAAVTGINPLETQYSLYGHIVPLSVLGVARIGGEIIAGPWVENGLATFCISFGVPADPGGSRSIREIAFDSEVMWTSADGFSAEGFTFRWYGGSLTQPADPIEIAHYGADAVAYRPQMLIWFENLPLQGTKFQKIPYVAAVIADATGDDVNLGEAFERLAYSPWVNYTAEQFETVNITDGLPSGGLIIAEQAEFLGTIQQFGRFYRNWDILQTDRLRIVDRGSNVTPDIYLDRNRLMDQVVFARAEPNSVPRELELSTIDPEADYTIVPSKARRPRDPVNVSASVGTESSYLPAIMVSSFRQSIVTYAKYHEEVSRKRLSGTASIYGLGIEPGDLVAVTGLGDDFQDEMFKVVETLHGANYTLEFTAEALLNCTIPSLLDPHWAGVVLLLGFEDADGSMGAPGMTDESSRAHGTAFVPGVSEPARVATAQHKFGSSSLWLPGVSAAISYDDHADWRLSSANSDQFTVECWVRFNEIIGPSHLLVGQTFSPGTYSWGLETTGTGDGGEFRFKSSSDGTNWNIVVSSGAGLSAGAWYHLAADKDATGKIRIYKNGVMFGSATPANSSMHDSFADLTIGCDAWDGEGVNGWIDELRITKGICRYGSDGGFPAPTAPFPRGGTL